MTDETLAMLQRWACHGAGEEPDITNEIGQLALRIVNWSLFSADVGDSMLASGREFDVANTILGVFFRFSLHPLNVPSPRALRLRFVDEEMGSGWTSDSCITRCSTW